MVTVPKGSAIHQQTSTDRCHPVILAHRKQELARVEAEQLVILRNPPVG